MVADVLDRAAGEPDGADDVAVDFLASVAATSTSCLFRTTGLKSWTSPTIALDIQQSWRPGFLKGEHRRVPTRILYSNWWLSSRVSVPLCVISALSASSSAPPSTP